MIRVWQLPWEPDTVQGKLGAVTSGVTESPVPELVGLVGDWVRSAPPPLPPTSQGSFANGLLWPNVPLTCALGVSGNWIEIAYGTSSGAVRVIVQHPETVGSGPQLFQTFTVHRSPVTKIMLSEKHLVSGKGRVCAREEAAHGTVPGIAYISQTACVHS